VPCGYGCAESGRLAPRPEYNEGFRQSVSAGMKRHHATKLVGASKKYKNWKKLWLEAIAIKPDLDPNKNLGGCPITNFEFEYIKLSKWKKKRVLKIIKI